MFAGDEYAEMLFSGNPFPVTHKPLSYMIQEPDKRLAAVMFTDMVGYTALMQQDEAAALQQRKRHREVFEQQHTAFHGEIIQYFGDGTLSIFSSSCDAVACAVEMQRALHAPIQVPLRIGIHAGNVLVYEDGIVGDAVNIASRIESFANVGGVLVSDAVQDQLTNQPQWAFVRLGKFQLKNVERPFEIYAVSAEGLVVPDPDFLQGKGQKIAIFKSKIPLPATPILGREKEIADLMECLTIHPVVTITGTGGMGKTRLALEIGNRMKTTFSEGIAFVSLANLTQAAEVMPAIATTLEVKDVQDRKPIDGIIARISGKKALLILDNLEQVIEVAREIAELAAQCPNLKILCTSRSPLKILSEQEYPLQPLSLPESIDTSSLMQYSAIELFVSRAQKVSKGFKLTAANAKTIVEICRRVDGLPLALELAAARIRILPPDQLLHRLSRVLDILTTGTRDLPQRHQTLRATIAWSHSLLNDSEQQLFRRLAVFSGGFTLEAVEEVCYKKEETAWQALDALELLLDKGLLQHTASGSRFSLLQTIKDFAQEQLEAANETNLLLERHAAYYLKVAQQIGEGMQEIHQLQYIKQGMLEYANIRVALDYLLQKAIAGEENASEIGLQICGALSMFWHIRGMDISIRNYILAFLETSHNLQADLVQCKAIGTLAGIYWTLGNFEKGKEYTLRYYALAEQLNHPLELLKAGTFLSFVHLFSDIQLARDYSEKSVALARKLKTDYWLTWVLWGNGLLHMTSQNFQKAREMFMEARELIKRFGQNEVQGTVLSSLAMLELMAGNQEMALELLKQALSTFEAIGSRPEEARILNEIAWIYLERRTTEVARKYFLDSVQAYHEVGSMRGVGLSVRGLAAIEAIEGRPGKAVEKAAAAENFVTQEGIVNVMYADHGQGNVYIDQAKKALPVIEIEKAESRGRMLSLQEVLQISEKEPMMIE